MQYIHIEEAAKIALKEIAVRREGKKGLLSRWNRFNGAIGGGFQEQTNYVFAAIAGSGKSAILNMIEEDICMLNPLHNVFVLSFNMEMTSSRQVLRMLSRRLKKTVHQMLSAKEVLSDEALQRVHTEQKSLASLQIFYYDVSGTIEDMYKTALEFRKNNLNSEIVCTYDHSRLARAQGEKSEKERIDRLALMTMHLKKDANVTNIILSQMNRDIEQPERRTNAALHFPGRSDIFGSDSLYQCADVVCFPHRPEILDIQYYGLQKMPTKDLIVFHIDKNRDGPTGHIRMRHNLSLNVLEEINLKTELKSE